MHVGGKAGQRRRDKAIKCVSVVQRFGDVHARRKLPVFLVGMGELEGGARGNGDYGT